jgi:hypothetical protein
MNRDSWEYILIKTDFCKFLLDLLVFKYYQNDYDTLETFLILDFIDIQQLYLSKMYNIEFKDFKEKIKLSPEFDYNSLDIKQRKCLMIKAIINLLYNTLENKIYIFHNKKVILNLLNHLNYMVKYEKIYVKDYKKYLENLIMLIE